MTLEATTEVAATAPLNGANGEQQIADGPTAGTTAVSPPSNRASLADKSEPQSAPLRIGEIVERLSLFVAPPSLVTALLFWMGWVRTDHFWRYFGVHQSVLEFSSRDYILRSMDVVYPCLSLLLVTTILMLVVHRVVTTRLHDNRIWSVQLLSRVLFILGAFCLPVALNGFLPGFPGFLDVFGLGERSVFYGPCMGVLGTLSLGYACYLTGRIRSTLNQRKNPHLQTISRAFIGPACGLLLLFTFWAADEFAGKTGAETAARIASSGKLPFINIFSTQRLNIIGAELRTPNPPVGDPGYQYGYFGLRFLLRSGNNYFLLSDQGSRRVVVLPGSPGIRFEYAKTPTETQ